ncbi:MAG: 50S ribosomal protein L35 [Candidatus Coatesbacteria bacterium]|nr:50S ribosomal protein L35 [Candidatus Coatesbacteria bacterium]
MPKMKTNRSTKKRLRKTASGHLKRWKAYENHLRTSKSRKRIRNLRKSELVSEADFEKMSTLVPYL